MAGDHDRAGETAAWICDLTIQHQVFRARLDERDKLMSPDRAPLSEAFHDWQMPWHNAILQPVKPQIVPSIGIPQPGAEHDVEPEVAG
jgi:hypothetical protein